MAQFQVPETGFGSYLSGILPDDIAVSAGAFAAAMQQVKNAQQADFEKLSQVIASIETTKGLDQVNGTDVPTNASLAKAGAARAALGTGPNGGYTFSDFFGCMSGLPYMWGDIYKGVSSLQTSTLNNIYNQLFLAVTWEQATASVQYTTDPNLPDGPTTYTVTGITLTSPGGGYGRYNSPAPTVTLSNGGTAVTTISTNPNYPGSTASTPGTYGRVTSLTLTSPGSVSYSVPTIEIQAPPISGFGNNPAGTVGWPNPMNGIVSGFIAQANAEIRSIKNNNPGAVKQLNAAYDAAGTQLTIEQRARFSALAPVPIVSSPTQPKPDGQPGDPTGYGKDNFLNAYPDSIYAFVDAMPELAQNTLPHMSAQTIDAISDLSTPGGQSAVAKQREERNARRLIEAGIYQDNNVPGAPALSLEQLLLTNGTVPIAVNGAGITINNVNGFGTGGFGLAPAPDSPSTTFTLPAILLQKDNNDNIISPIPIGYTNPNTQDFNVTPNPATTIGQLSPIAEILAAENNNPDAQNLLGPAGNGVGPALNPETNPGIDPTVAALFPPQLTNPIAVVRAGVRLPVGPGTPIDLGQADYPGSLAGTSPYNLLPNNLNTAFTAGTLLPATYSVPEAIEAVIICNCDCWDQ